tara:strand:- start:6286 stop:6612 length:327 start_codon:yes stop_codon:yes gene_type:complete
MDSLNCKLKAIKEVKEIQEFLRTYFVRTYGPKTKAPEGYTFELSYDLEAMSRGAQIWNDLDPLLQKLNPLDNPSLYIICNFESWKTEDNIMYFIGRFASGPELPTFGF